METTTERLARELETLQRQEFKDMQQESLIPEDTKKTFKEWLGWPDNTGYKNPFSEEANPLAAHTKAYLEWKKYYNS
jgi:hypothetical protein